MTYLTVEQVMVIHAAVIAAHGGDPAVHDAGLVDSAVSQPQMTWGGQDLYLTLPEKAAALGFSLTKNHGFKDGNKRVGFTTMDTFLRLNGYRIVAPVDDAEETMLAVADGHMGRDEFTVWVRTHVEPLPADGEGGADGP
jgi:death-on-curing protein